MLLLGADLQAGLTSEEAERRLHRFGPNLVPEQDRGGRLQRIGRQFASPLIIILLVCAGVSAAIGNGIDAGVILAVVAMNAIVGYIQESKAEAELAALRELSRTTAEVIRDGVRMTLPSEQVVPGDLVQISAGAKVPADIRLLASASATIDESPLTGESMPVLKETDALPRDTPLADRVNMAFAGTLVTSGSATGVVVSTGGDTALGGIHRLVGGIDPLQTPLTKQISRFSAWLTLAIVLLATATFVIGIGRGEPTSEMFSAAIALAVGAIPEGLPAAVTITLAIGVGRMARRHAVVRALPSVETLGSTTVICTDKTGTLTMNRMTVRRVVTAHHAFDPGAESQGQDPHLADPHRPDLSGLEALRAGALCNDAEARRADGGWVASGDPTESALVVAAAEAGLDVDGIRAAHPRVLTVPFDASRRTMRTVHRGPRGLTTVLKGSFEAVLPQCGWQLTEHGAPEPIQRESLREKAEEVAAEGFRVIAVAEAPAEPDGAAADSFIFLGFEALQDPPRPSAVAAVKACRSAGIRVKMITGDHPATAAAIAAEVGIDAQDVYARVSPEEKLDLVRALQAEREVVAMTGDGVNDAPALRQADIGVAMGLAGTDVAKEASDLVLLDDDFATVEAAVEEGRGVFTNLTKFIVWTLPTNMAEGLIIVAAVVAGSALPILPVQILWINMTTAVFLGLMLAFEPKEPGLMARPPRDPRTPIMTPDLIVRVLLVSVLLITGAWWLFDHELSLGFSEAEARTTAMNLFVAVEAIYLFSCRSLTRSAWQIGFFSNPWLWLGLSVQVIGQLAITYVPAMNRIFSTAPIPLTAWGWILGVGVACSLVVTLHKYLGARAKIGANR